MKLKNLILVGLMGVAFMASTDANNDQSTTKTYLNDNFSTVRWVCHRHRCHQAWPVYEYPYHAYHPYYRNWAQYCQYHPFSSLRCERFCHFNRCVY